MLMISLYFQPHTKDYKNVQMNCKNIVKDGYFKLILRKQYEKPFYLGESKLENVNEFTYLGVTIYAACSFKPCIRDLSSKATRSMYAINSRYKLHKLPIDIALKLF